MKKLIALAVFLVTWKTFTADMSFPEPILKSSSSLYIYTPPPSCDLNAHFHKEEATDWFKARARRIELENTKDVYDVKVWEFQEPESPREVK